MNAGAAVLVDQDYALPLSADVNGVIRVAGTRVTLDTVAEAFARGATAEEIAQQYPSLSLADIYSVLGHLLRHESEVAEYLANRQRQRTSLRAANEKRFDPVGVRARLLARRKAANGE